MQDGGIKVAPPRRPPNLQEATRGIVATLAFSIFPGITFWWLLGEEPRSCDVCVDRAIEPPQLPDGLVAAGVLVACIGLPCILAWVIWLTSTKRLSARWWCVWLPAAGLSLLAALIERAGTAPVGGANIGFGFLVLFSAPWVPSLLGFATWHLMRLLAPRWNGWLRTFISVAVATVGTLATATLFSALTGSPG